MSGRAICKRLLYTRAIQQESTSTSTHFGFKNVPQEKKEQLVGGVFSSVARNYDIMNDAMSFGIHRVWKDHFVNRLNPGMLMKKKKDDDEEPMSFLDVAGGTGDIAFRILDYAAKNHGDYKSKMIITDINNDMLREGKLRCESYKDMVVGNRINFLQQNAETLNDIQDNSQDLYTVAFGIRNFTNIPKALSTAYRVLKTGGVFACLEFSKVNQPLLNLIYNQYSFSMIPLMGQLIAGDRDSYQYLVESIERFPNQEKFASMIKDAGFQLAGETGYENLTFGVAAIHIGVKL